ncbi:hypothetical protein FS837_003435, partial [Tulasnella sp. UAMH 9824]
MPAELTKSDFTHEILEDARLDTLSWRWVFFNHAADLLNGKGVDMVLGDWNHVESEMDRLPRSGSTRAVVSAIANLKRVTGVEDTWQEENPTDCEFTWERPTLGASGHTSRSRLDRILLTEEMAARSTDHVIDIGLTVSDHYPVRVTIIDDESPDIGKGRWRMNLEDLEDEHAMEKCRLILLACQRKSGREPMTAWLEAKRSIKRVLVSRQTMCRRERSTLLHDLERQRRALTRRNDFASNAGLISMESNLRERIAHIKKGKMERTTETSAARFADKGESVNKYWFSIGKSMRESSTIKALSDDDGVTRDTPGMAEIARKHHESLQASPDMTPEREEACRRMAETTVGKRFSTEAQRDLEREFGEDEAREAIMSAQTGKAPGKDGIRYEFYKYWVKRHESNEDEDKPTPNICAILARVWNDIKDGRTPPEEYVEGLMFLLYKKKRRDK